MTRFGTLLLLVLAANATAEDRLTVAVASNFQSTLTKVAAEFQASTGTEVRLSSGSTGKLYAQIVNGAPYDVFLAADMERPRLLEQSGAAVAGSLRQYASGRLVLVSADDGSGRADCMTTLRSGAYRKLAIANPATSPYGAAAKAWLQSEGLWDAAEGKIVMGENIGQTFQFVATGNATLGLVSAAQLRDGLIQLGCQMAIETTGAAELRQGGIVLRRSENIAAANQFMEFLTSDAMRALLEEHGYEAPSS